MLAQSNQWFGTIQISQPISMRIIACVGILIGASIIFFIVFGSVVRKSSVAGITVPTNGSVTISTLTSGILLRSLITEGAYVNLGEKIFEVSTERLSSEGEMSILVERQINIRKHAIESETRNKSIQNIDRRRALEARLANNHSELLQLDQEIELANHREILSSDSVKKFQTLQKNGYVSDAQTQQKQEESLDLQSKKVTLIRAKVQLEGVLLGISSELKDLKAQLAVDMTQLEKENASLEQELLENQSRKSIFITAPQAGIISTITYQPGQTVSIGQVLATLLPKKNSEKNAAESVEVHLYTPSRTAGFIMPGQRVMLRFDAYPYQKFGLQEGRVVNISRTPFAPGELPVHLASTILSNEQKIMGRDANEALYRIKIKLANQHIDTYGRAQQLAAGMTVTGDILQERRRIWEWIAEPLIAVSKKY